MFRRILAGCNGRDRGLGAVSFAYAVAAAEGARLTIAGVHLNPPVPFESYGTATRTSSASSRRCATGARPERACR